MYIGKKIAVALLLVLISLASCSENELLEDILQTDPPYIYDRQNTSYVPQFEKLSVFMQHFKLTTYFSPDHSIDTLTAAIQNAEESIDISTPYFRSWLNCTDYWAQPIGCPVERQRNEETFSVFPALLNAIHRGVKVRLMTNWIRGWVPNDGLICPLEFLTLAGAEVRYFTTVTFLHAKYLQIDKKRAYVSSVNWSENSIMGNREAGVIIEGPGAPPILDFLTNVYESDLAQAPLYPAQNYTAEQMAVIMDPTELPVVVPPPPQFPGAYVSTVDTVEADMDFELFFGPDHSFDILMADLKDTQSLNLFIYQITSDEICQFVKYMGTKQRLKLLVSHDIYDKNDSALAAKCYQELSDAGIEFRMTRPKPEGYVYSHNKFWMVETSTQTFCQLSTGNWSPPDLPYRTDPNEPFVPWPNPKWVRAFRDINVGIHNKDVCANLQKVMDNDYDLGVPWKSE